MDSREYDREKLYQEVWRIPLRALAKQYQATEQQLRKVCKELEIPLPKPKHWDDVQQSQPTQLAPLPPLSAKRRRSAAPRSMVIDDHQIEEALGPIKWPPDLHPALIPLRHQLDQVLERARRVRDQETRPRRLNGQPQVRETLGYGTWATIVDNGYYVKITHRAFAMRISLLQYERGVLIFDAICKAAEKADFRPHMDPDCQRLELHLTGAKASIRLSEQLEEQYRKGTGWRSENGQIKYAVPTGLLKLYVEKEPYDTGRAIADDKKQRLEQKTDLIIRAIISAHQSSMTWRDELDQTHRRIDEAAAARQEAAALIKQENERQKLESDKQDALLAEVENWKRAQSIRAYIDAMDHALVEKQAAEPDGYKEWREWAIATAERLDNSELRLGLRTPAETTSVQRLLAAGITIRTT